MVLGENCSIAGHVIVRRGSVLGNEVTVDSFAVIGGNPQSLSFDASIRSGVRLKISLCYFHKSWSNEQKHLLC